MGACIEGFSKVKKNTYTIVTSVERVPNKIKYLKQVMLGRSITLKAELVLMEEIV